MHAGALLAWVQLLNMGGGAVSAPAETPGGTYRRAGDTSRVFRRHGDPARTFGRKGDTSRVFRRHDSHNG